jgi:hypothetical protein
MFRARRMSLWKRKRMNSRIYENLTCLFAPSTVYPAT